MLRSLTLSKAASPLEHAITFRTISSRRRLTSTSPPNQQAPPPVQLDTTEAVDFEALPLSQESKGLRTDPATSEGINSTAPPPANVEAEMEGGKLADAEAEMERRGPEMQAALITAGEGWDAVKPMKGDPPPKEKEEPDPEDLYSPEERPIPLDPTLEDPPKSAGVEDAPAEIVQPRGKGPADIKVPKVEVGAFPEPSDDNAPAPAPEDGPVPAA
jgi:hypothetical protein